MQILPYIITVVCAYILGSSNMAYYISKIKKVDVKNAGSKNLGASNATMILGWYAGILSGVHDILKAVLAVILANLIFPEAAHIGAIAGVACVLGHIFPFYLKFNGGKGFASFIGAILALNFKAGAIIVICAIIAALIVNYMVGATTTVIVASPIVFSVLAHSFVPGFILLVASLIIAIKHIENYVRIYNGTEFRLRKAFVKKPDYNA